MTRGKASSRGQGFKAGGCPKLPGPHLPEICSLSMELDNRDGMGTSLDSGAQQGAWSICRALRNAPFYRQAF